MIKSTAENFTLSPGTKDYAKEGGGEGGGDADAGDAAENTTDRWQSGGIAQVIKANMGGSLPKANGATGILAQNSTDIAPEDQSVGAGNFERDAVQAAAPPQGALPKPPGNGYDPTGAQPVETPVVAKRDSQVLDGEGNLTTETSDALIDNCGKIASEMAANFQATSPASVDAYPDRLKPDGDANNYDPHDPTAVAVNSTDAFIRGIHDSALDYARNNGGIVGQGDGGALDQGAAVPDNWPQQGTRQPTQDSPNIGGRETAYE